MFKISLFVAAVLFVQVSFAEQEISKETTETFKLGFGVSVYNSLYKGNDTRVYPVPIIYYDYGKFSFTGNRASYLLHKEGALSLSAIAKWRFDGYEEDDSDYLTGMDDRDMTLDGGAELAYSDGWGKSSLLFVTDLLGRHDGQEAILSYSKKIVKNDFTLTPSAGLIYKSGNLSDYYYGVRAKEAMFSRPEYNTGETWNPFVRIALGYKFNKNWSSMGVLAYKWLDSNIEDSPIVKDGHELSALAGLVYSF